jgi:alkanesulfonate monooxygenase SsuD/methylene tetrahydromethanopterin reductase-like flavin-dependent oxidoreductase (luciferase family)
MTQASFGVFDWIDRAAEPLHRLYEDRLQLLQQADEAGFFCYHLAEHHATPLGMAPSPALFLTAATQRTRRIRLGPLVYLLPLYDPLRLIEEVAMLDQLSGGRLELGVGRGVSPYELRNFGIDPADSRAKFDEALSVLLAGLTRRRLSFTGAHYRYDDVPIELQPLQQPYPPLWYPTHTPTSVEFAGRHGFNFVSLGAAAAVREHTDAYWRAWHAHRHDPDRLNGHVEAPRVGVLRLVVVADSDDEAAALARGAHAVWFDSITRLWHEHGDHSIDGLFSWETAIADKSLVFGSPPRVCAAMEQLVAASGCNYVLCAFAWGALSRAQAGRSLQLFADEVMPAFATSGIAAPPQRDAPLRN